MIALYCNQTLEGSIIEAEISGVSFLAFDWSLYNVLEQLSWAHGAWVDCKKYSGRGGGGSCKYSGEESDNPYYY